MLISSPTIPEVVFERIKSDVSDFAFNFFQDGQTFDVVSKTYKFRLKASGVQVLEKTPAANAAGRVLFVLSSADKAPLTGSEYSLSLIEVLAGGGERTIVTGTLRWSVPAGKNIGLVTAPDVSVNYIAATGSLMVALGVVDFGSSSSALSAAAAAESAALANQIKEQTSDIKEQTDALKVAVDSAVEIVNSKTLESIQSAASANTSKIQTEAIKVQAQTLLDNALLAINPQGDWNPITNTPALTATPVAGVNGTFFDLTESGLATFSGANFTSAVTILTAGGKLIKKNATQWFYQKPSDAAYVKVLENKAAIETPRVSENLLVNSTDLNNWNKTGVTTTNIDDALGLNYGVRIAETAITSDHFIVTGSVGLTMGKPATFSVYVRPGTRDVLSISLGNSATWSGLGGPEINFTVNTGVLTKNGLCAAADVIKLPNGWYRIWLMSNTHITGTTVMRLRLKNGVSPTYAGSTDKYGDFCFPQISYTAEPIPYAFTINAAQQKSEGLLVTFGEKTNWNGKVGTTEIVVERSKNLFNAATGTDGFYLGSGNPSASATYGYSDFIAVETGQNYTGYDGVNGMRVLTLYNSAKIYVSDFAQAPQTSVVIPEGIAYIKASYYAARKNSFQFEKSATPTVFEAYYPGRILSIQGNVIGVSSPSAIIQDSTHRFVTDAEKAIWNNKNASEVIQSVDRQFISTTDRTNWNGKVSTSEVGFATSKNLFDVSMGTDGFYLNSNGSTSTNAIYGYSDFIQVLPGEIWTASDGVNKARMINFYNLSKVNQPSLYIDNPTNPITIPTGAAFARITYYVARKATFQFEKSSIPTTYTSYGKVLTSVQGALVKPIAADLLQDETHRLITDAERISWNSKTNYTANAVLPSKMHAIVGREFNLYYDAFTLFPEYGAGQPNFLFDIDCAKGVIGYRSFRITPVASDVGEYPFTFKLLDQNGAVIETITSTLVIVPAVNPSSIKYVLHDGDSTIDEGSSTKTLQENLAALGGNVPVFLGQHHPAPFRNEARTGRTYGAHAVGSTAYKFYVTGLNPALDISNIRQAYYTHGNTNNMVLLSERWKINPDGTGWVIGYYFSAFTMPTAFPTVLNGTSASTSAGFPATLNVTGGETLSGFSIFKDSDGVGALNIEYYRTQVLGLPTTTKIDLAILDFGINDVGNIINSDSAIAGIVNNAKILANAFIADNALGKVVVCLPKSRSSDYYVTTRKHSNFRISIHKLRKKLIETFDFKPEFPNVFVSQSGYAVDRFYGYPNSAKAPASRIATPTFLGTTDDVHPALGGYQQHADGLTGAVLMALNL